MSRDFSHKEPLFVDFPVEHSCLYAYNKAGMGRSEMTGITEITFENTEMTRESTEMTLYLNLFLHNKIFN